MAPASIHATAVAIDGEALLIAGPSRAGKSRLAAALIARATQARPIVLIGDDRVLLCRNACGLVARPHPRIAGFLERRGLGIVAMDWLAEAPVGGVVELRSDEGSCRLGRPENRSGNAPHPTPLPGAAFSHEREKDELRRFALLTLTSEESDPDHVLAWWASRAAAEAPHPDAKSRAGDRTCAKD